MDFTPIKSIPEFLEMIHGPNNHLMFRGQGNKSWPLLPSIARYSLDELGFDRWTDFQDEILERFRMYSLPYLSTKPENLHEWLIIAQHHGLPTNLLDWTSNPLKAAFFAVENPALDNLDAVIWAFEPSGYYKDLSALHKLKGDKYLSGFLAYFPAHISTRVISQESCFTFFPLTESNETIPPLESIGSYRKEIESLRMFVIPKEKKTELRNELTILGISHLSLFPGLDGISKSICRSLETSW